MARTKNQVTGAEPRKLKPILLKNGTMEPTWADGSTGGVCCWAMEPCWLGSLRAPERRYSRTALATKFIMMVEMTSWAPR
jgi:hypothetical protein